MCYTVLYTVNNALASDYTESEALLDVLVPGRAPLESFKKLGGRSVVPQPWNHIHKAVPSPRHCNLL